MNYKHGLCLLLIIGAFLIFNLTSKTDAGKIETIYPDEIELMRCIQLCKKYNSNKVTRTNFSYGRLVLAKTHAGIIWACECTF